MTFWYLGNTAHKFENQYTVEEIKISLNRDEMKCSTGKTNYFSLKSKSSSNIMQVN